MHDSQTTAPNRAKRIGTAALVGVGVSMAGVSGSVFAEPPTDEEAAGAVIEGLATDGAGFLVTYGLPAVGIALGGGLLIKLVPTLARKVVGAFR
jgi:hypothetical protein